MLRKWGERTGALLCGPLSSLFGRGAIFNYTRETLDRCVVAHAHRWQEGLTMGANNSTRRVSFESDENENITVVKGIRVSDSSKQPG